MAAFTGTDRFEVRRCLGSGSFGVVYEAFDRERDMRLALKMPHAGSAQNLYLFKQEFRALADITHPNLATLFELLTDEDRWFFTMELVDGSHLLDFLRGSDAREDAPTGDWGEASERPSSGSWGRTGRGGLADWPPGGEVPLDLPSPPPDFGRVRSTMRQLAEGLMALHAGGMLHRDLKPSNVLVSREGRVVILDFGLVADLEESGLGDPLNEVAGTPSYMSPEQISGRPTTTASDWYSVGVLFYQAITGRLPFAGTSRAMLAQKLQHDPLEPSLLVPGIPEDLESLCMALLSRDPERRPRAREVVERLRAAPRPGQAPEPRPRSTSLVGREAEMAQLVDAFRLCREGRTVAALLHGDSGTGKSVLARGFLREVGRQDERTVVLQGRCYEQESVPFKALDSLVDSLSQYLKRMPEAGSVLPRNIHTLARLFPVLHQVPAIAEAHPSVHIPDALELRRRAFGALREVLRRLALRGPVVLMIDDMQWGDQDSAVLLTELLRAPDAPHVLLLLCYRSDDSPMLQEFLPRLAEAVPDVCEVELKVLSRTQALDLARALLGTDGRGQAEWIAEESGGSPFFIQELVQHLQFMDPESGHGGDLGLDDYIQIRVEALGEDPRTLLETLAVAGSPLDWDVLQAAAAVGPASLAALTSLRAGHLIRMRASARRRIMETYHDRIRVAVVRALEPARLRAVNLALAMALESLDSSDAQALARHFEDAGEIVKAGEYALRAAAQAEAALAFERAAAFYRKAIQLGTRDLPGLRRRLGDALANAGRGAEVAWAYLEAAGEAHPSEANRLHRRAAEELLRSGNIDRGLALLDQVLAAAGVRLPTTRPRAVLSLLWHRLRLALRGLDFVERSPEQISAEELERVDTLWAVAMGLGPVDVLRAADFQTRQLLLTLKAGEPFRVVRALAHETILVAAGGNRALEKTHQLRRRTQELAERIGHPNPQARALMAAGIADTIQGRWRDSALKLERAAEILRQNCTGMDYELHLAQQNALAARLVLGDLSLIAERLPALLQEAREKGDLIAETNLRVSLSYILSLARDEPEGARQDLEAAIAAWSGKDFHLQHYHHLVSLMNIGLYEGAFAEVREAVRQAGPALERSLLLKLQPALVTILELQARTDLALAARSGDRGALLVSAQARIQALERERTPYGGALALKLRGMQAVIEGRTREAQAIFLRAERTFEACDMPLHVLALRHWRGRLEHSVEEPSAAAALRARGIQNPWRFAAMHVPLP